MSSNQSTTPTKANETQVGGTHYRTEGLQHWDLVTLFHWDYFQAQVFRYLMRWRDKDGLKDVRKAAHVCQKYVELVEQGRITTHPRPVAQRAAWLDMLGAVDPLPPVEIDPDIEQGLKLLQALRAGRFAPTGWIGFTYEGTKDNAEWYRCTRCREHFQVEIHASPTILHICNTTSGDATPAYVNQ